MYDIGFKITQKGLYKIPATKCPDDIGNCNSGVPWADHGIAEYDPSVHDFS